MGLSYALAYSPARRTLGSSLVAVNKNASINTRTSRTASAPATVALRNLVALRRLNFRERVCLATLDAS